MNNADKDDLEEKLVVGAKIKIGQKYSEFVGGSLKAGEVIELIEGYFDYDNGLYSTTQTAPSILEDHPDEYSSIYHLFGNDLEDFMDCEVVSTSSNQVNNAG